MCGIVGYVGQRQASEVLVGGLGRLGYQGHDSAGAATIDDGRLEVVRRLGELVNLERALAESPISGTVGIAHTRWATHGRPSEENAHPHVDCTGRVAVVHNGIIENHLRLRRELEVAGHVFRSETDTEVVAHLIEEYYEGDITEALRRAAQRLEGSYAIVAMHIGHPDTLAVARRDSQIVVGLADGESIVASDIPAVLEHTRDVLTLRDGEIAAVTASGARVVTLDGDIVANPEVEHIDWDLAAAEKGGFEHFMLKEIFEQPHAIRETLRGRMGEDGRIQLSELEMSPEQVAGISRVFIVGCGTSYHAGMVAKTLIEQWARIPVAVEIASEFRYSDPIVDDETLVVAITQSGETGDTLAAVREARARGAKVMAITNVVGSRVTRESDGVIYTHAGPEIGIAATKSFTTQIAALYVLALKLAQARGALKQEDVERVWEELAQIPEKVAIILEDLSAAEKSAQTFAHTGSALFLGRGIGASVAKEGALKLKEVSYVHAEAYPAGEILHGPIALIADGLPIVVIATQGSTYDKTLNNIQEVRARGAEVIAVATQGDEEILKHTKHVMYVPATSEALSAIPATVPLQLLAYYVAKVRGCNVDQPRNLVKSVMVG